MRELESWGSGNNQKNENLFKSTDLKNVPGFQVEAKQAILRLIPKADKFRSVYVQFEPGCD